MDKFFADAADGIIHVFSSLFGWEDVKRALQKAAEAEARANEAQQAASNAVAAVTDARRLQSAAEAAANASEGRCAQAAQQLEQAEAVTAALELACSAAEERRQEAEAASAAAEAALLQIKQEALQARADAEEAERKVAMLLKDKAHLTMEQPVLMEARGPVRLLHVERLREVGGRRQVAFCGLPGIGKSTMVARLLTQCGYPDLAEEVSIVDIGIGTICTFVGDMPNHNTVLFDQRGCTEPLIQDGEAIGADMLVIAMGSGGRGSSLQGHLAIMAWRLRDVATAVIVVTRADDMLVKKTSQARLADGGPACAMADVRRIARSEVASEVGGVLNKANNHQVAVDPSVTAGVIEEWLQTIPVFVIAAELQDGIEGPRLAPFAPLLQAEWVRLAAAVLP